MHHFRINIYAATWKLSGFTLIELLIVVVILAIAAAIGIPMLSNAGSFQVDSAADLLAGDLEYARSMAITMQKIYTIEFDDAGNTYSIKDVNNTVIKHPVNVGSDYTVTFGSGRYDKVDITDVNGFSSTPKTVTFDYLGSPDNGGSVELTGGGKIKNVKVETMTGLISITD